MILALQPKHLGQHVRRGDEPEMTRCQDPKRERGQGDGEQRGDAAHDSGALGWVGTPGRTDCRQDDDGRRDRRRLAAKQWGGAGNSPQNGAANKASIVPIASVSAKRRTA
jgi:hypothetical protein